jgi:hypothetical protein
VPQLTLVLTGRPANDVEVRIDDRVIPVASLKEPIPVDPGEHVITATAPSSKPFRTVVFLPERGRVSLTVPLDGTSSSAPVTTTTTAPPPDEHGLTSSTPQPPPEDAPKSSGNSQKVWGAVIMGTGAAAMVAGGVLLVMRSSDISTLKRECEGGCPPEKADELQSIHDRATLFGPLGGALLGGGAAVAGLGAWFFFSAKGEQKAAIVPWISPTVGGLTATGRF